jgi:hypothetical protein
MRITPDRWSVRRWLKTSNFSLWFWKTVQQRPIWYLLFGCFGLVWSIVLIGMSYMDTGNEREAIALKIMGGFLVLGYIWMVSSFAIKVARGTWGKHCEAKILQLHDRAKRRAEAYHLTRTF